MLMDLFYDTLPPNITRKRRVHFHAFMIDMHKAVHALKSEDSGIEDPILPVARDLAREMSVLCFDEFQVRRVVGQLRHARRRHSDFLGTALSVQNR